MINMNSNRNFASVVRMNIEKEKWGVFISCVIITMRSVLLLLPSLIIQVLIDEVLGHMELAVLWKYCLALSLIPVVSACSIYMDKFFLKGLLRGASASRAELMRGLVYQDYQKQKEYETGMNAFLVCDSVNEMASKLFDGTGNLVWCVFTVLSGLIFCMMQNVWLTIYLLIITLAEGRFVKWLGKKTGQMNQKYLNAVSEKTTFFRDSEAAVKEIKMQGQEERFSEYYEKLIEKENLWSEREQKNGQIHKFSGELADALVYVGIYVGGAFSVLNGVCSVGNLVALGGLYDNIFMPIRMLGGMFLNLFSIKNVVGRINEIFYPYSVQEKKSEKRVTSVGLQNVWFCYGDKAILKDVSLEVNQKYLTFLCGESGSGKSTICDLLLGLIKPEQGQVIVNGSMQNVNPFRKWIHYVSQKPMVINGTLRQNLLYGLDGEKGDVSENELKEALYMANLDGWLKTLPNGLDTFFENEGFTLSGGEKQRICLARALLGEPDILILDEAVSAVDAKTVSLILARIKRLKKRTGILFITHNRNSDGDADVILELEGGSLKVIKSII